MFYKNAGPSTKTFYGVTFEPGETAEVNGRINHHNFISVSPPTEPPVVTEPSASPPGVVVPPVKPPEPETKFNQSRGGSRGKGNRTGESESHIPAEVTPLDDTPSSDSADGDKSGNLENTEQEEK